ncbi:MAG: M15 family metallopeptidase [Cyclobacteriaceae bacterium]
MDRRTFSKYTTLGIGGTLLPSLGFGQSYSFNEIIGKTTPALFGEGYQLRKEAHEAYSEMSSEASKAGIELFSVSSYRSFLDQKRIWDGKFERFTKQGLSPIDTVYKIIEYSTIPGTSRHHWGTDIDIIDGSKNVAGDRLLAPLFHNDGPYVDLKNWLNENASVYDFLEVYSNDPDRKGFKYEPWHFSYAPIGKKILKSYTEIDFEAFLGGLDILGSSNFTEAFIQSYWDENMLDINPRLVP